MMKMFNELVTYVKKMSAAYRLSYRRVNRVYTGLMITSAVIASSAFLALVPAIPIFVGAVAFIPSVINIVLVKTKLAQRACAYKKLQKEYHKLLIEIRYGASQKMTQTDFEEFVHNAWDSILKIEQCEEFIQPLEKFMKRMKLSCYSADAKKTITVQIDKNIDTEKNSDPNDKTNGIFVTDKPHILRNSFTEEPDNDLNSTKFDFDEITREIKKV